MNDKTTLRSRLEAKLNKKRELEKKKESAAKRTKTSETDTTPGTIDNPIVIDCNEGAIVPLTLTKENIAPKFSPKAKTNSRKAKAVVSQALDNIFAVQNSPNFKRYMAQQPSKTSNTITAHISPLAIIPVNLTFIPDFSDLRILATASDTTHQLQKIGAQIVITPPDTAIAVQVMIPPSHRTI